MEKWKTFYKAFQYKCFLCFIPTVVFLRRIVNKAMHVLNFCDFCFPGTHYECEEPSWFYSPEHKHSGTHRYTITGTRAKSVYRIKDVILVYPCLSNKLHLYYLCNNNIHIDLLVSCIHSEAGDVSAINYKFHGMKNSFIRKMHDLKA